MTAIEFWNLFYETGHPVFYTLYRQTLEAEERRAREEAAKTA
jgi:hypothetical protein